MTELTSYLLLGAALASAVAAAGSWRAAHKANATATTMERIERDRRHDEMTPNFQFRFTQDPGTSGAILHVAWAGGGPAVLEEVTLRILDEVGQDRSGRGLPPGMSRETADSFVWGPWEFNPGASDQVIDKRTTRPRRYSRAEGKTWDTLALQETQPGSWMSMRDDEWADERRGPIRVSLTCKSEGYWPWTLLEEVET